MSDITEILLRIEEGDAAATEELLPLVYNDLRRMALAKLRNERPDHTLQATALVHEAYLRLVKNDSTPESWGGRGHFFAAAAEAMRRILIESIRQKNAQKRGGGLERLELDTLNLANAERDSKLLSLDLALQQLEEIDAIKANLVKLRFFAGLTSSRYRSRSAMDSISVTEVEQFYFLRYLRPPQTERRMATETDSLIPIQSISIEQKTERFEPPMMFLARWISWNSTATVTDLTPRRWRSVVVTIPACIHPVGWLLMRSYRDANAFKLPFFRMVA